ncbi:Myristoyl-CoA:protein N-myristoyltransferase domain protein [Ancylostoma duodenale]|uniref:Glycylpeptide N-tetradecanoyltransferase n=1 Tax=Ancylostoma duodenale TaxID=51022 RepID=A0A0C2GG99_9BILA|nr:Myristoyl-CoA:protein N-myristoyltransferase domain protein [Ancylostoma duodenale]
MEHTPVTPGLRPLEKKDISSAWKLLSEYLKQFSLAPVFTKKEFEHIFTPIDDVVYTYVVETGGKVTDMLSFYSLPSSVMHHPVHKSIRAVYSFYNVATTIPFKQLMNDALILAHKLGFDVFNALDLMQNASILEELKAVQMPGWLPQWHCGVRAKQSGRLLAFIAAVPQTIRVYDKERPMVEINFLCVHKKLRSKRVAPVLIREITRRVNQQKIFQAVYTAGVVIPKPVGVCRYWHRSLNPKKLIDVRFSHLSAKMTMARTIKLYKLPDK